MGGTAGGHWQEEEKYLLSFHLPSAAVSSVGLVQIRFQPVLPRSRLLWGRTMTQNTSCSALFGGFQSFTGTQKAKVEL